MKKRNLQKKNACDRNNTYFQNKPLLDQVLGPAADQITEKANADYLPCISIFVYP